MRWKLNFISYFAPKLAANQSVNIFSKVRIKTIKEKEQWLYDNAKQFYCDTPFEKISCYELGNPNGKLIFLVHGWDSNAGSLSHFAKSLKNDYRIISLDLPAHGKNKKEGTNLYESKEALKSVLKHIQPKDRFDTISHSFESSVVSIALSELPEFKADKVVLLSSNNEIEDVFVDFRKLIGFNNTVYKELLKVVKEVFGKDISEIVIADYLKSAEFNQLLLIHDTKDKVISFKNSERINDEVAKTQLIPFIKIGHYRMLWHEEVLNTTLIFLKK